LQLTNTLAGFKVPCFKGREWRRGDVRRGGKVGGVRGREGRSRGK